MEDRRDVVVAVGLLPSLRIRSLVPNAVVTVGAVVEMGWNDCTTPIPLPVREHTKNEDVAVLRTSHVICIRAVLVFPIFLVMDGVYSRFGFAMVP